GAVVAPETDDDGSSATRAIVTRHRRGPTSHARRRTRMYGLLFAAPGLLIYGSVVLWPLVQSLQYSFYEWDGITAAVWVGFDNYLNFFTDPVLRSTLGNVLVLIVFFAVLPIALGLLSAALITSSKRRGMAIYRWIFFLPQVLTSVV